MGLVQAPDLIAERLAVALLGADPRVQRLSDGRWALVAVAGSAPLLEECAFAVIDVETTGGSAAGADRIIEVAVVLVQGERRELVFESLVNPGRPIPAFVSAVTGITNAMVRDAPAFEEVAGALLDALAGRVFVAHNARFDWRFVVSELKRARALRLDGARLCTVRLARRLVDGAESCALDALTDRFALNNPARHRAAGDALATAELLHRLLRLARQEGARTLNDLDQLQSRQRRRKRRSRRGGRGGSPPGAPLH
jgi:DNA polymerase-3 subunit epsilon